MTTWITPKTAADRLGISTRWLLELVKKGILPRKGEGSRARHPWPKIRDLYIEYAVAQRLEQLPATDLKAERAGFLRAKRRLAELELEEQLGNTMTADQFDELVEQAFTRLAVKMRNWPGRWAPEIRGLQTNVECVEVLERMVAEGMEDLRDTSDIPDPENDDA